MGKRVQRSCGLLKSSDIFFKKQLRQILYIYIYIGQQLLLGHCGGKKGHWVASADIQKNNGLSKKPLVMGSPPARSGTFHIVSSLSYIFSRSPTLLCFPLCWLHSQARHSSHCIGKVVITNSRLNSTRLVASRKESAFFPTISGKSRE